MACTQLSPKSPRGTVTYRCAPSSSLPLFLAPAFFQRVLSTMYIILRSERDPRERGGVLVAVDDTVRRRSSPRSVSHCLSFGRPDGHSVGLLHVQNCEVCARGEETNRWIRFGFDRDEVARSRTHVETFLSVLVLLLID